MPTYDVPSTELVKGYARLVYLVVPFRGHGLIMSLSSSCTSEINNLNDLVYESAAVFIFRTQYVWSRMCMYFFSSFVGRAIATMRSSTATQQHCNTAVRPLTTSNRSR